MTLITKERLTQLHQLMVSAKKIKESVNEEMDGTRDSDVCDIVNEEMDRTNDSDICDIELNSSKVARNSLSKNTMDNEDSEMTLLLEKVTRLKSKSKDLLCPIYQEILRLFDSGCVFEELKEEMMAEYGTNITKTVGDYSLDIADDSCPIVVTGETSAGKSTFVNLLLGVDLLPQSSLTCTSTICRISNKPIKSVFLTDLKNNREEVPDIDAKDNVAIQKLLKQYLCQETSRIPQKEYKYVDICWPFRSLQGNVMIVDTPGIGPDNPELTKRLFEYLPQALALIYILNTPNAGGIQSDRILRVQEQIEKQSSGSTKRFDPRRAIFICNKWDLIYEHPDEVFAEIQTLLEKNWTSFHTDKVFKLSTRQAVMDSSAKNPISDDFRKVVKSIENMIPLTTELKIRQHLEWQITFIERMRLYLSVRLRNSVQSEDETMSILRETEGRIQILKLESEEIKKRINEKSFEQCKSIMNNIYQHLNDDSTKSQMFSWSDETLPDFPHIADINRSLNETIECKVNEEVKRILKKQVMVLTDDMRNFLNAELCKIGEEFRDLDQNLLGEHVAISEARNDEMSINISMGNISSRLGGAISNPGFFSFLLVPVLDMLSFFNIGDILKDKFINRELIAQYNCDKIKYANTMVDEYLEAVDQNKQYKNIGKILLKNLQSFIQEYFENAIPKRIASCEALIKNIRADLRAPREIREKCHQTEIGILPVYGQIILAYNELFGEKLFPQGDGKTCQQLAFNFDGNCKIRSADLKQKCPQNTDKRLVVLAEISDLRECHHDNLVKIYCIISVDQLEVYMEKCDTSLDIQVIEGKLEWEFCRQYLIDSLEGLNYLHNHGIVHKNIRLENIQIKDNKAKLSGGGITEWESLTGQVEGIPIIRAPEVLRNRYYGYEADIFQFGVVLWECWYKERAFLEIDKTVKTAYDELYTNIIDGYRPLFIEPKPDGNLWSLIETCWDKNPEIRPSAKEIQDRF